MEKLIAAVKGMEARTGESRAREAAQSDFRAKFALAYGSQSVGARPDDKGGKQDGKPNGKSGGKSGGKSNGKSGGKRNAPKGAKTTKEATDGDKR